MIRGIAILLLLTMLGCADNPGHNLTNRDAGGGLDVGLDVASTFCPAGARQCTDVVTSQLCSADGSEWVDEECLGELRCNDQDGTCSPQICSPGAFDGCTAEGMQRY